MDRSSTSDVLSFALLLDSRKPQDL
jgi:hypothetical protein